MDCRMGSAAGQRTARASGLPFGWWAGRCHRAHTYLLELVAGRAFRSCCRIVSGAAAGGRVPPTNPQRRVSV